MISTLTTKRESLWQMFASLLAFAAVAVFNNLAVAEEPSAKSHVAYRLAEAKTQHFDDTKKADEHIDVLKKLGCEIKQEGHEGHIDVAYRCVKWRVLPVADEKLAHQWVTWLSEAGFETLHGHSAEEGHDHGHAHNDDKSEEQLHEVEKQEEVAYRLANWATFHPRRDAEAEELIAIVKGFGCEIREGQHAGHRDVSVICPEWKHIEFATHEAAEVWQQWLAQNGFEAKHTD